MQASYHPIGQVHRKCLWGSGTQWVFIFPQIYYVATQGLLCATALLVYDWCISLGGEATLFWRAPRTSASILYLFNRYCIMLEWVLAMITIQPVSDLVRGSPTDYCRSHAYY